MWFKVQSGVHNEDHRTYYVGDVVNSRTDLAKRFNIPNGCTKFQRLNPLEIQVAQKAAKDDTKAAKEVAKEEKELGKVFADELQGLVSAPD